MPHKILLVEDEADILKMYALALAKRGFEIDTAPDGQIALAKLQTQDNKYDLLLLDLMLPKVDGIEILKIIKSVNSSINNLPVFLLTNLGAQNIIKEAQSLGVEKYFVKTDVLPGDLAQQIQDYFQNVSA